MRKVDIVKDGQTVKSLQLNERKLSAVSNRETSGVISAGGFVAAIEE